MSFDSSSVNVVFQLPDEYSLLETNSVLYRIRAGILQRGMLVHDAFKAFNSSGKRLGYMTRDVAS
jgi:hypothetical protein